MGDQAVTTSLAELMERKSTLDHLATQLQQEVQVVAG